MDKENKSKSYEPTVQTKYDKAVSQSPLLCKTIATTLPLGLGGKITIEEAYQLLIIAQHEHILKLEKRTKKYEQRKPR